MKEPSAILKDYFDGQITCDENITISYPALIEAIKDAQIEAYNEAIVDASVNVEQTWDPCHGTKIDKDSILKLKKVRV